MSLADDAADIKKRMEEIAKEDAEARRLAELQKQKDAEAGTALKLGLRGAWSGRVTIADSLECFEPSPVWHATRQDIQADGASPEELKAAADYFTNPPICECCGQPLLCDQCSSCDKDRAVGEAFVAIFGMPFEKEDET